MEKIKQIISASIETKQQLLRNENLLMVIEKVVDAITKAFSPVIKFISAVMEEAQLMPNIWRLNSPAVFISIENHCLLRLCIAIPHSSLQWGMITVLMLSIPG